MFPRTVQKLNTTYYFDKKELFFLTYNYYSSKLLLSPTIKMKVSSKKVAVTLGVLGALGSTTIQGVAADFDTSEWSCVTEARATDFIRTWDEQLGGTKLSSLADRCQDASFDKFETNARQYQSDIWNQAADYLTEVFMPTLNIQKDADEDADAYYCDKGIKWYTVNGFKGCTLQNGKTYDYRGTTYKAQGNSGVMEVDMTISYVCNQNARVRNVAVSYTTATKTACRP